jgi:hypothetical protein
MRCFFLGCIEFNKKHNLYVKDYDSEQGMIEDLVYYRFTTLPVIGKGVEIKDVEVDTYEVIS